MSATGALECSRCAYTQAVPTGQNNGSDLVEAAKCAMALAKAGAIPALVAEKKTSGYNKPVFVQRFINALKSVNSTAETELSNLPAHKRNEYLLALDETVRTCIHCEKTARDPMCVADLGLSTGLLATDAECSPEIFDGKVACRACAPYTRITLCGGCSKCDALETDDRGILMCTRCKVPAMGTLSRHQQRKRLGDALASDGAMIALAKRARDDGGTPSWEQYEGALLRYEGDD